MKNFKKRVLSMLIAAATAFTAVQFTPVAFSVTPEDTVTPYDFVPGIVKSDLKLTYPPVEYSGYATPPATFTSPYISNVDNQGPNGLCWAFAANGLIESHMMKKSQGKKNLSELHVGYSTSTANGNSLQGEPFRFEPSDGGNRYVMSAYLMRGTDGLFGCVNDSDDPYGQYSNIEIPTTRPLATTKSKLKSYTVQNTVFLSDEKESISANSIKEAVMEYGSASASMYWEGGAPVAGAGSTYFNTTHSAYYLNVKKTFMGYYDANHEVLICGWDDNYSKDNFNIKPANNGAWYVKNSWGSNWGDDGFFWISYSDPNFPLDVWVVDGVEQHNNQATFYETDYTGMDGTIGYPTKSNTYARSFSVKSANEVLKQVRFGVLSPNLTVKVDVIPNFTGFTGYTFSSKASMQTQYPGYYSIDINPVTLGNPGSKFAVIVEVTAGNTQDSRLAFNYEDVSSGAHSLNPNNGRFDDDIENYCIKAVTIPQSVECGCRICGCTDCFPRNNGKCMNGCSTNGCEFKGGELGLGRVLTGTGEPAINDVLEILKYLVNINCTLRGGNSNYPAIKPADAVVAARVKGVTPATATRPIGIDDVLEILKFMVNIPSSLDIMNYR